MPTARDLRIALARAKERIRVAEDSLLAERRRSQELASLYADADTVRPETLPRFMKES